MARARRKSLVCHGGQATAKAGARSPSRPGSARDGILGDGETAVIEMAEASGPPSIPRAERNPLEMTTYGTGELIVDAIVKGDQVHNYRHRRFGDGRFGTGVAQALGVKFMGANGKEMTTLTSGGMPGQIAGIDISGLIEGEKNPIIIASDVDNRWDGRRGAAYVSVRKKARPGKRGTGSIAISGARRP